MSHPAWPIIVQQASICHDVSIVCRLLCASKDLQALIAERCAGQVSVSFRSRVTQQEWQFADWLAHWGSKLLSNHLEVHVMYPAADTLLETFEDVPSMYEEQSAGATTELLEQLPAANITSLVLNRDSYTELASIDRAMKALAGLTSLQHISIGSRDWTVCAAPLFPALQGLTSLTSLKVNRIISVGKLKYLPKSLLQLDLGVCSPGISLTHLTALTSFRADKLFCLDSNDLLPRQLLQLQLGEVHSVQRLVELKQLRSMSIGASHIPARRLQRVAKSLTQLTEVKLSYQSGVNEAADAWALLPIRHLELELDALSSEVISAATMHHLAQLTQLTYLHIQRVDCVETSAGQLAANLQQLFQLRGLKLWASAPWPMLREPPTHCCTPTKAHMHQMSLDLTARGELLDQQLLQQQLQEQLLLEGDESSWQNGGVPTDSNGSGSSSPYQYSSPPATAAAVSKDEQGHIAVMQAVAGLPHLMHASFSLQGLGCAAAAELVTATQLTFLKLRACDIDNNTLEILADSLTGLKSLFAEYNRGINDKVLPMLCEKLPQLTELDVRYTCVSDAGKQYLATLQKLKTLQV